jgi:hypothetical protein
VPLPPLSEVAFKGFDHHGQYSEAEHTDMDRAKKEEAEKLLNDWWMRRMNPRMGWEQLLKEDKSRLDNGLSVYHAYDDETRCGRAIAHCYVNATPAQVMGVYVDRRTAASTSSEVVDLSYTTATTLSQVPIPIPAVSNRDALYRSANFRDSQEKYARERSQSFRGSAFLLPLTLLLAQVRGRRLFGGGRAEATAAGRGADGFDRCVRGEGGSGKRGGEERGFENVPAGLQVRERDGLH